MADTYFLSSLPTLALGGTVAASYFWLAIRRPTGDVELDTAIHLAAGIFWCSFAYSLRPLYWALSGWQTLPRWGLDYSAHLDAACNVLFAYGAYRAHRAIFLLLPEEQRSVSRWLAWAVMMDAPRPVRRLLARFGRAMSRVRQIIKGASR